MSIMMGNSRISFLQLTTTKYVVLFIIIIIIITITIIDEVVKTSNMNDIFTVMSCVVISLGLVFHAPQVPLLE
jgi:hypothetical protein